MVCTNFKWQSKYELKRKKKKRGSDKIPQEDAVGHQEERVSNRYIDADKDTENRIMTSVNLIGQNPNKRLISRLGI